jgi:hypothetical protein
MISGPSQGDNRRTAAIASRSRAPSTPQYRVPLRPVHSGAFSSPGITLAFRRKGRRSPSFARPGLSLRCVSQTGEPTAIARSVSSARAASAAKSSPVFRDLRASDLILSLPDAPPCGRSRPDGRRRLGHGSILSCELCTPRFILVSERLSATKLRIRGQVRAMWHWARELDAKNLLVSEFTIPTGVTSGSRDDTVIRSEEGWILGCPCS